MTNTPVYRALYNPVKVFGVPPRLLAAEGALLGISLFVLHNFIIVALILVTHLTATIIMHKESEWKTIISFLLLIPNSEIIRKDNEKKLYRKTSTLAGDSPL